MTDSAPLVSIVVPVRNGAWCIERALRSLFAQTLGNIEILCVDDASDDETPEILARIAASDSRLRVIRFDENRGTAFARKTAVLRATGRYVLFLDADDELLPDACRALSDAIAREKVDFLQFGAQIVNEGDLAPATIAHFTRLLAGRLGKLRGRQAILQRLFDCRHNYHWVLWNKIYDVAFLRKGMELMEDGKFTISEDLYLSFLLFSRIESISSVPGEFYVYHVGRGSIRPGELTLEEYAVKCSRADCCHAMRRFLDAEVDRLYPGRGDPDAPLPDPDVVEYLHILRRLYSALLVGRMRLTLEQIPCFTDETVAVPFFEVYCRAWDPRDFWMYIRVLRIAYARTHTLGFRIYSRLSWPLGFASSLWKKLRAPKKQEPPETESESGKGESDEKPS